MKKKIFVLIVALVLLTSVFTACSKEKTPDSTENGTSAPKAETVAFFPAFESETLDGKKVTDEIFKGNKVTMVNVWGTFCSPCINEMPALQKLSENYKNKGVRVIGVLCDTSDYLTQETLPEKVQLAKDIVKQTGAEYTHILSSPSLNKAKLDSIFSVPTTYFLNEDGELLSSEFVGSKSYDQWSAILDSILEIA